MSETFLAHAEADLARLLSDNAAGKPVSPRALTAAQEAVARWRESVAKDRAAALRKEFEARLQEQRAHDKKVRNEQRRYDEQVRRQERGLDEARRNAERRIAQMRDAHEADPGSSPEFSMNLAEAERTLAELEQSSEELQRLFAQRAAERRATKPEAVVDAESGIDELLRSCVHDALLLSFENLNVTTGEWKLPQSEEDDLASMLCGIFFRSAQKKAEEYGMENQEWGRRVCRAFLTHPVIADFFRSFPDEASGFGSFGYMWNFVYVVEGRPDSWFEDGVNRAETIALEYLSKEELYAARARRAALRAK